MDPKPVALRLRLPYKDEREFVEKYASHIARNGVFVATPNPKPEGTAVAFEFRLTDNSCPLSGEGVVVKAQGPEAGSRAGMTLRFVKLTEQGEALVEKALAFKGDSAPEGADEPEAPWLQSPSSVPVEVAEARRRRRESVLAGPRPEAALEAAPIIGVDFGTTQSRAAVVVNGRTQMLVLDGKQQALPMVTAFDAKGRVLVGNRARASALLDPRHSVPGVKRLLGLPLRSPPIERLRPFIAFEPSSDDHGDLAAEIRGRKLRMVEVAAPLFAEIRERATAQLGKQVSKAVIALPSSFSHVQREAVREAAALAGLEPTRLISDTTAVALSYAHGKAIPRRRLLIYDMGAGTFGASVVQIAGEDVEVISTAGDNQLGGIELDLRIATELRRRFTEASGLEITDPATLQRVREAAEAAKIGLSERTETVARVPSAATKDGAAIDLEISLTREQLEALCVDLVERSIEICRSVLAAPGLSAATLDEVLLVGGQTQSPMIRTRVERAFGRPVRSDPEAGGAVASGAAVLALATDEGESRTTPLKLTDVLGVQIGVAARDGTVIRVLDRNTRVPCQKSLTVPPAEAERVRLDLFQGTDTEPHSALGFLTLPGDGRRGSTVVLSVSAEGLVTAGVRQPGGELSSVPLERSSVLPEELSGSFASSPFSGEGDGRGLVAGIKRLLRGKGNRT